MMIQRRFRSCCAHCGYCLLCSAAALLLLMLLLLLLAFNASQAFCFVVALWLLLLIWFLFTGIEFDIRIPFTAYKTYNFNSLLLLSSSLLAAAWVAIAAAAAASTFDFRFEFSSSFLQLLHTTLISTQRCTNTQTHTHVQRHTLDSHAYSRIKFIRPRHESPCIHIDM